MAKSEARSAYYSLKDNQPLAKEILTSSKG